MSGWRRRIALAGLVLGLATRASADGPAEIVSLRQLKELTAAQASNGPPVRIKGSVVCYDAGWHQLYIHDGHETLYFNADDFATQPSKGDLVEISGRARGTNILENGKLTVEGSAPLPAAKPMNIGDLIRDHGEWVQVSGRVLSAETSRGRLSLLIHDQNENCLLYILGAPPAGDFRKFLNSRIRVRGINASRTEDNRLDSAMVFVAGADEITVLTQKEPSPAQTPVTSIGSLLNRGLGSWTNEWVHVNGLVVSYQPGHFLTVKDPTGAIEARVIQLTEMRGDERADVWGFLKVKAERAYLDTAYFEVARPPPPEDAQPAGVADATPLPALITNASEIFKLRPEQAARQIPARLRGVFTCADPDWGNGFLQNGGDAVYVDLGATHARPETGQWVELTGHISPGGFAPQVLASEITVLGSTNLPPAARVDLEDLANGRFDSHWVEMEGLVRRVEELSGHVSLTLMTPKGRFRAIIPGFENKPLPMELIDAAVAVEGACTSELNVRRQLSGITLHVPSLEYVRTISPAPSDPFAVATTPITSVATFDPERLTGRRIKIQGVVTLMASSQEFIVQDVTGGIRLRAQRTNDLHVGDLVEAVGFPVIGDFSPYLEEVEFQAAGSATLPNPRVTSAEEILLRGNCDAQIVTLSGRLLQSVPRSANPQWVVQDGPIIFTAELANQTRRQEAPDLKSGSRLKLTGVCSIQGGQDHEPQSFRLLLRSAADVQLIEAPAFWTAQRAFMLAGGLTLAVAAALGWVALLRRQVRGQTYLIRQKLKDEAALEERYRELFENATDMLYTHDRHGRITSINAAGERLLQRPRAEILGQSIFNFVAEDHRGAARQWLASLVKGVAVPTVEWDFLVASGERVKLEISARLIEQNQREIEVEGIARDITERKRLEREILEISNREQRRIGHDLHDGICQQLAGIAFLTATLAEDLEEEGLPHSGQAEKISGMLNDAIDQTRGMARGLFPVRLDEKGLVASLEELASNAGELYKIACRFRAAQPGPEVENEIALHLYYIVLEALANAAKHSGASAIEVALQPVGENWLLSVSDNGSGFSLPSPNQEGMGLRILNYRARVIGATLSLQSEPGCGTTVSCLFSPASPGSANGPARRVWPKAALAH